MTTRLLRPALVRYEADGETQYALPAVQAPRPRVVPTAILVTDAIERYLAFFGRLPEAVALSPLRYLSLARAADGFAYSGASVPLCIRRSVGSDEARALGPHDTAEFEAVVTTKLKAL